MNPKQKRSLPSVERSVTLVDPPPLDEYFNSFKESQKQKDEFTVADFIKSTGMHDVKARRVLSEQVVAGKLARRFCSIDGRRVILYRLNQ